MIMQRFSPFHLPLTTILAVWSLILLSACAPKLHQAAQHGDPEDVKRLLARGERLERPDIQGNRAIHVAVIHGHLPVLRLLLQKGESIDRPNTKRRTPLALASLHGHLHLVKFLIGQRAKLESKDYYGNSPFMLAALGGNLEVVKFLASQGVNTRKINGFKESALSLAIDNHHEAVAQYLKKIKAVPPTQAPKQYATPPKQYAAAPIPLVAASKDRTPPRLIVERVEKRGIALAKSQANIMLQGSATDDRGTVLLWADGKKVELDAQGRFWLRQPLLPGMKNIQFIASDEAGNQTKINHPLTQVVIAPVGKKQGGTHYALIIGNNNYPHLARLKTPKGDAQAVAKLLEKSYGFQTELLLDAKRDSISKAMNRYRKLLKKSDSFLLYYAGHGIFDKRVNKAYWLPLDAAKDDDTNWLITDSITAKIQRLPARHVLVVADSCYSGTLSRSANTDMNASHDQESYLKQLEQRSSRTLMASGGNEPVSDSSRNGRHSIFAWAFLQALRQNQDQALSAEKLFYKQIKEYVAGNSEQVPEYSILRNSGHEGGDFIFYRQ